MLKQKFSVGGEFVLSPTLLFNNNYHQFSDYAGGLKQYHRHYTFGAYYSMVAIIAHLDIKVGEYILLPSYLCPSMLEPFRKAGVKYDFYKMLEGLLPDLEDIERKSGPGLKAILFVDYFGFPRKDYLREMVKALQSRGVKVLQDTVQSWLNNERSLFGDFCFNSLRKYTPFEASVLLSKERMIFFKEHRSTRKFLVHKRWAQLLRYYHLRFGIFSTESFLKHIDIANSAYHKPGIADMPLMNTWCLDRIDFITLGRKRRYVYNKLISKLSLCRVLKDELGDVVPLALPIYLSDRDSKRQLLHQRDIYCPLHWRLSEEIDKKEHDYSWDLEQHELTLPLNVNINSLELYINRLKEVL